jgi:hypothetical protein
MEKTDASKTPACVTLSTLVRRDRRSPLDVIRALLYAQVLNGTRGDNHPF